MILKRFFDRVFDRNWRRDYRLGFGVWLDHRQGGEVAVGLVLSDILSDLCYPAADHDPESKIHFQRDQHRVSPAFLIFENR